MKNNEILYDAYYGPARGWFDAAIGDLATLIRRQGIPRKLVKIASGTRTEFTTRRQIEKEIESTCESLWTYAP